jgi:hypothetical protein
LLAIALVLGMTLGQGNNAEEEEENDEKAWKEFKGKFNRQYKSAREEAQRYKKNTVHS